MADLTQTTDAPRPPRRWLPNLRGAWPATLLLLLLVAVLDWPQFGPTVIFAAKALLGTAPFILFAVLAVAYLKASGAETLLAKAFEGNTARMIVMAALLMDPAMFAITSGTLGFEFAVAKTLAAVGLGLMGGFGTWMLARSPIFTEPLRERPAVGGCCGVKKPFSGAPVWKFWTEDARRDTFREAALENGLFLLKWLTLAYVIEALMLHYVPAEWIAGLLGGTGLMPILLGALVGAPAYLNGYAAVPLVDALLAQGMTQGAAMSFVIAGGVSCIPAAVAVWALVKPRVFAAYLGFAVTGAMLAGVIWQAVA